MQIVFFSESIRKIKMELDRKKEFLKEFIDAKKSDKVMNVGVGWASFAEIMLENDVKEMWGADIDKRKIEKAEKRTKKTKFIYLDAQEWSPELKESYFDKVTLFEVLEHIPDDLSTLKNINKMLKSNGELIISVPTKCFSQAISPLNWIVHKRHYSEKSIKDILKKTGFEPVETEYVGNWLFNINLYTYLFLEYLFGMKHKTGELIFKDSYYRSWRRGRKSGMSILIKARKI